MEIKINCRGADALPLGELKDFQGNLKTITSENLDKLKRSIKKHGFTAPIFVWDNAGEKNILDGHQRLKALIDIQGEGVHVPDLPVVYVYADNENDAREKLLYITSQYGEFTNDGILEFTNDLEFDFSDIRLSYGGFDFSVNDELEETIGDDYAHELQEEAISQIGEIYELGPHRLMCGDSTDAEQVERLMGGEKADMVFTDPPYGVSYQSNMRTKSAKFNLIENDDTILDIAPILASQSRGWIFVWTSWKVLNKWIDSLSLFGYPTNMVIWHKPGGGIGDLKKTFASDYEVALVWNRGSELCGKRIGSVWTVKKDSACLYVHPTQKPVQLVIEAVDKTTLVNSKVLDLFGGSGSTIIACAKTNRQCRMMELDPKYCDVIRRRWTKWATENGQEIGSGGL